MALQSLHKCWPATSVMYRLEPHNPGLTRIRSIRHFSHYDRDCDGAIEALADGSHGIESLQLRRLAHWLLHRLRLWFSIILWPRETDRLGAAVDKGFYPPDTDSKFYCISKRSKSGGA